MKFISKELMKLSIQLSQISLEIDLGIEKIESIKNGTEIVLSFIPVVSTGVSIALLFDETKTLDEKAWELVGIIPYGKTLKYVGKIDEVVVMTGGVVRKIRKLDYGQNIFIIGMKHIDDLQNAYKSGAKRWSRELIDEIKLAGRGDEVEDLFQA